MIFTTSWDDGTLSDLRIAELLDRYNCTGTFYACPATQSCYGERVLKADELERIGAHHELGAHSLSHPHLPKLPEECAWEEITGSKEWMEEQTGKPCTMFCYPYGDADERTQSLVEKAGFKGARSTEAWKFSADDPFLLHTSLHLYPFPIRPILNRRCIDPIRRALPHLRSLCLPIVAYRSWFALATHLFEYAENHTLPFFHLWGHGWEIEKYRMWNHLERFLSFVSTKKNIQHAPNSAILSFLR